MATVLDHTIVPVIDREKSVEFYTRIFGFDNLGEVGPFLAVRVNDTFNLDFRDSEDFRSIHYAFAMDADEFESAFARIKEAGIPYPAASCEIPLAALMWWDIGDTLAFLSEPELNKYSREIEENDYCI